MNNNENLSAKETTVVKIYVVMNNMYCELCTIVRKGECKPWCKTSSVVQSPETWPMNLITNIGCKLGGSFLSSSQILHSLCLLAARIDVL